MTDRTRWFREGNDIRRQNPGETWTHLDFYLERQPGGAWRLLGRSASGAWLVVTHFSDHAEASLAFDALAERLCRQVRTV